jgi:nondiscriminating aspartyl-tRNA synthetase
VTAAKGRVARDILEKLREIPEQSSVGVRGRVRRFAGAPNGAEIVPDEIRVLGAARRKPPFSVFGGALPSLEKRLDMRAVDLRREKAQSIFAIERVVLSSLRDFFGGRGFLEVRTPKLISTATEGGASLFTVLYYNRPSFLTQSPQLYKEELVMPFEKVYEIGPAFRAEESRTQRHLSEITSIDIEEAYVDYRDVMDTLESAIMRVLSDVGSRCAGQLARLKRSPVDLPKRFERLTYERAIEEIGSKDGGPVWGDDIGAAESQRLAGRHPGFYFVTDWPTSTKPFYIRPKAGNPKTSESFDLMHGSLELASGGTRVSSKSILVKRLREQRLKPQAFEYHLGAFDFGMPPHAGFGLGLERLMMAITGEENIREVALFPRDKLRLVP